MCKFRNWLKISGLWRRERDSNPWSLSAQRFSRPPQSTTLPSLRSHEYFATNSPPGHIEREYNLFVAVKSGAKIESYFIFSNFCSLYRLIYLRNIHFHAPVFNSDPAPGNRRDAYNPPECNISSPLSAGRANVLKHNFMMKLTIKGGFYFYNTPT